MKRRAGARASVLAELVRQGGLLLKASARRRAGTSDAISSTTLRSECRPEAERLGRLGLKEDAAAARRLLPRGCDASGVTARPPHDWAFSNRHSSSMSAAILFSSSNDIRHVQGLLGHRSLTTTALYTKVEISDLRHVLRRAHPRERAWWRRGR